jgi:pilus assembly protein CpaE
MRELDEAAQSLASSTAPVRVALAIEDLSLQQEVLDLLERDPRIEVIGATSDASGVGDLLEGGPDLLVASPSMARDGAGREASVPLLLIAEKLTVPILRGAIRARASCAFGWPDERQQLMRTITQAQPRRSHDESGRGRVIAIYGARGGIGTTFVATHLAAFLADGGIRTVLVDLDASSADVAIALGIGVDEAPRTIADLIPVMRELAPDHLEDALYRHQRGFSALLGSQDVMGSAAVPTALFQACIALLAGAYHAVVLHAPRAIGEAVRRGLGLADEVVVLTGLDAFSLYGARRAMGAVGGGAEEGRCRLVISRAAPGDLTPADAFRVLGVRPSSSIRFDRRARRAQERGDLLPTRRRGAARDIQRLAEHVMPSVARGTELPERGAAVPVLQLHPAVASAIRPGDVE